jgi:hypothetical protein
LGDTGWSDAEAEGLIERAMSDVVWLLDQLDAARADAAKVRAEAIADAVAVCEAKVTAAGNAAIQLRDKGRGTAALHTTIECQAYRDCSVAIRALATREAGQRGRVMACYVCSRCDKTFGRLAPATTCDECHEAERRADARDAARWRAIEPVLRAWVEAQRAHDDALRTLTGNSPTLGETYDLARYDLVEAKRAAFEAVKKTVAQ